MTVERMEIAVVAPWDERFSTQIPVGAEDWVRDWETIWIRLIAEDGTTGDAFAWGAPSGAAGAHLLAAAVRPEIVGASIHERELLWHRLRKIDRLKGLFPKYLLGPVDVALWDLAAKQAGLPLYRYLGAYRSQMQAYAASLFLDNEAELISQSVAACEEGFHAVKIHTWGDPERDIAACRALRRELGSGVELMVDVHGAYDRLGALRVARILEDLGFTWMEEPLPDDDLDGYVALSRQTSVPIAGLQSLPNFLLPWGKYLSSGAVDIALLDASWKGGITGLRKLANACEVMKVGYEIASGFNALMSVANLHVACASQGGRFFEVMVPSGVFDFGIAGGPTIDGNGMVSVPEAPGLGVELDGTFLERHTILRL